MLTIYRRHRAGCRYKARRAKCFCPIWVQGILNDKKIRRSLNLTSWEAASKLVRDWEADGIQEVLSIKDAVKRFVEDQKSRGLSSDTTRKFELLRDELVATFGDISLSSLSADDVAKFREGWKLKPSTARKKLERMRSFFKFCVERGWIKTNPARTLRPPKEDVIEKKPYDTWELEKIEWAIPLFPVKGIYGEANRDRIRAFITVLRWTGLRIRDVVQLKRSMVSDEFITLRTHKNGKPVQLPIHPEIKESLGKLKLGEYFFWSGEGNAKSCVGDWQRTLRRLPSLRSNTPASKSFSNTALCASRISRRAITRSCLRAN